MEFTPINTQEEFEARVTEVYGDVKGLQGQITTLTGERDNHAQTIAARDTTIAELQGKVKGYETAALKQRIAREKNIPLDFADRLSGETEADIKADADAVAKMLKAVKGPAPMFDPSGKDPDAKTIGMATMLSELRGE